MRLAGVAATSLAIAAQRAREHERPDRLFDDQYAELFVRAGGEIDTSAFPKRDPSRTWEVFEGYFALRTRYFDDRLLAAACPQVVLLASGLDTRPWRLPWPATTRLYELDLPEVLEFKAEVLAGEVEPVAVTAIPADLATDDWAGRLAGAGFRPDVPTAWLVEGLLMYLSTVDIERLLGTLTALSAPGSHAAVETRAAAPVRDVGSGELLVAPKPTMPRRWLEEHGWRVEASPIAELGERYGRPLPPEFEPPGTRPEGLLDAVR